MIERERERDRDRDRGKKSNLSPTISCRSKLDRTRVKTALRNESYVWVLESQDFTKVRVFMKTEKRMCPKKSR